MTTDQDALGHYLRLWGISEAERDRLFDSTCASTADLLAAARLLEQHVAADRIPDVVRRPAQVLGGRTLLDLALSGEHAALHESVRAMLDIRRVQP